MQQNMTSTGRGGAGNISSKPTTNTEASDLVTPTIKSDTYTTGRGGSGNMAKNDPNHPEIARASQDVEAPTYREQDEPHHFGRGGAANVVRAKSSDEERARSKERRESESKDLKERGKNLLEKIGGKK